MLCSALHFSQHCAFVSDSSVSNGPRGSPEVVESSVPQCEKTVLYLTKKIQVLGEHHPVTSVEPLAMHSTLMNQQWCPQIEASTKQAMSASV